jgi:hypothetical protein
MNYIAKSDGFVGGARIRKGQVFAYEGKPGKWMEPAPNQPVTAKQLPAKSPKAEKTKAAEPTTMSELAKRDSAAQAPRNDKPGK